MLRNLETKSLKLVSLLIGSLKLSSAWLGYIQIIITNCNA